MKALTKTEINKNYVPLQLGPNTVGWIPKGQPTYLTIFKDDCLYVVMDGDVYSVSQINIKKNQSGFHKMLSCWFNYYADTVLQVPDGSLDFDWLGRVSYTERTCAHVSAALRNYDTAMRSHHQAKLSALPKEEAFRYYTQLLAQQRNNQLEMNWRGVSLDSLVKSSSMIYAPLMPDDQRPFLFEVCLLDTFSRYMQELLGNGLNSNGTTQVNLSLEDVFQLKAASKDEYDTCRELIRQDNLLRDFLRERFQYTQRKRNSVQLFLFMQGDSLEDWVRGEEIPIATFLEFAYSRDRTGEL